MNKTDLLAQLQNSIVQVEFVKKDGSTRQLSATLMDTYLPAGESTTSTRADNPAVQSVWDTEADGWRSFRWASVKSVNGEYFNGVE